QRSPMPRQRLSSTGFMERHLRLPDHSALMLADRITLPHFSVSEATSLPNSAGNRRKADPLRLHAARLAARPPREASPETTPLPERLVFTPPGDNRPHRVNLTRSPADACLMLRNNNFRHYCFREQTQDCYITIRDGLRTRDGTCCGLRA